MRYNNQEQGGIDESLGINQKTILSLKKKKKKKKKRERRRRRIRFNNVALMNIHAVAVESIVLKLFVGFLFLFFVSCYARFSVFYNCILSG